MRVNYFFNLIKYYIYICYTRLKVVMLVCLAFLAADSGMEADSVLLGVLVFGAGSGSRSAKGRFAGLAADGHFSL